MPPARTDTLRLIAPRVGSVTSFAVKRTIHTGPEIQTHAVNTFETCHDLTTPGRFGDGPNNTNPAQKNGASHRGSERTTFRA